MPTRAVVLALIFLAVACAPANPATSTAAQPSATSGAAAPTAAAATAPIDIKLGGPLTIGETPLYVAMEKGYLADEGLRVEMLPIDTAEQMIPLLSTGQLDIAFGGIGPGLYNAVARDIGVRLVAFGAVHAPGRSSWLMARKDLADAGQIDDYRDLKGKSLATPGAMTVTHFFYDRFRARGGLAPEDLTITSMTFPDMVTSLATNKLDVTFLPEPFAAQAAGRGIAVHWKAISDVAPNHPAIIWMYSQQFIDKQPDAARRFMVALLRGTKDYEDAIETGQGREEVIAAAIAFTAVKDRALYDQLIFTKAPRAGEIDIPILEEQLAWFQANGSVKETPDLHRVVDTRFSEYAAQRVGR